MHARLSTGQVPELPVYNLPPHLYDTIESQYEGDTVKTKNIARAEIKSRSESLIRLSHKIHANPEVGFEEQQASMWLSTELSGAGFTVQHGICDLPTAFSARAGSGPLHLAICAEYDSLPGIGHACGHNIIAAAAVGAGIAAAKVADDVGLTVSVIGTPAEEAGNNGGKIILLEKGAFDGCHAAMMVHPSPYEMTTPKIIATSMFDVAYTGKASHASSFPELGINAADALTIAQTAVGLLRQHIRPADRIHGIVTDGGDAPNIVPAHTKAKYMVRAETLEELADIRTRVEHCFTAGAIATGATLAITGGNKPYAQMEHDQEIVKIYRSNAETLGRSFPDLGSSADRGAGSTDMGNVSLAIPSIHPMLGIDSLPAVNHQPEFAAHCVTPTADRAVIDGATAMAWTAIDMATNEDLSSRLIRNS